MVTIPVQRARGVWDCSGVGRGAYGGVGRAVGVWFRSEEIE